MASSSSSSKRPRQDSTPQRPELPVDITLVMMMKRFKEIHDENSRLVAENMEAVDRLAFTRALLHERDIELAETFAMYQEATSRRAEAVETAHSISQALEDMEKKLRVAEDENAVLRLQLQDHGNQLEDDENQLEDHEDP